ncbi:oligosaccharide flippase family protein [Aequorivita sp. F47161]|uniref:Oligosaccharide flippase family protein n=1 Tax=Aequorivita vitellina TaxID=2874475 RepID=A0A9X1U1J7_9FLAO|nr:oligosaccharide flippase family protein [Aequorivita vitellina]MCG2419779.1 oligosaccharide flippase family protein [Aequorivita vitellina]
MLKNSSNTTQSFWILIGSLSAFSFSMVSSMILSRYFDKDSYGTYRQVMYVYSTLLVVFTLGVPKAYSFFLPRVAVEEAKSLVNKINKILLLAGFLMSLAIFLGSGIIADVLGNHNLSKPLIYFSLVPLFMLPTMGVEGVLSVYRKSKWIAAYNVVTRVLMLLCVVVPVIVFKGDVEDAIIGFTVASFFSFLLAMFLKYRPIKNQEHTISKISYKKILKYATPIMMASIWGVIISSADQFFISRYFGTEVFAEFANGSLELPFVGMIISAGSIVLAPLYSKNAFNDTEETRKEILRLWHSVFKKTAKLIYPLVIFCFCFATALMILLYGERYEASGTYFQIKLISNFFTLISYAPLLLAIGGEKYYRNIHLYAALFTIALEWASIYFINSPITIVWISVICRIARIIAMLLFIANYFNIKLIDLIPIKLISKILIPAFIMAYGIKLSIEYFFDFKVLILLILSGTLYAMIFGIWAYIAKIDYYSIVKPLMSKIKN